MRLFGYLAVITLFGLATSLPVNKKPEEKEKTEEKKQTPEGLESVLEYERYLKEVVEALESDQDFKKKLENAEEADITSGKIAQELEYVEHNVRSKLDELKRIELARLRELVKKEQELMEPDHKKVANLVNHLDHRNMDTFEIEDLRKLIKKTTQDLAEADKKRRDEFKQYEMQKEFEKNALEKEMDDESKLRYEEELRKKKEKHDKHEKLHHPGNKAQLEEVWEKQDHMDRENFDPQAFFMMHDVDDNKHWDENEVKALFKRELDKVYESGVPEDDMRERAEEMERMREHVFEETDTNKDGLISYQEFLEQTKREEFEKDPEWKTVDKQQQYTHEEYVEFERKRQEEIQKLIAQGIMPAHPSMPYGYHASGQPNNPNIPPPHYQQHPGVPVQYNQNQVYPQGQQYQQMPQQHYQQVPIQQHPGVPVQLNQNQLYDHNPHGQQYQQVPQQQYKQPPPQYQQGQQQYQQPQPQQMSQGQAPQQLPQGQIPQQQEQVPQQQGQLPPQQGQQPKQPEQAPQQNINSKQASNINSNSIH